MLLTSKSWLLKLWCCYFHTNILTMKITMMTVPAPMLSLYYCCSYLHPCYRKKVLNDRTKVDFWIKHDHENQPFSGWSFVPWPWCRRCCAVWTSPGIWWMKSPPQPGKSSYAPWPGGGTRGNPWGTLGEPGELREAAQMVVIYNGEMTRKSWSQLSEKSCFKPFLVHVMSS